MSFEPIAIVGHGCVVPGATSPRALIELVLAGRCVIRGAPRGRWRLDAAHALAAPGTPSTDRAWSDAGGYVDDLAFDPGGFARPPEAIAADAAALDASFSWLLHAARDALGTQRPARGGMIVGTLSFPTTAMARLAERVWFPELARELGWPAADPRARFMSGLPVTLAARALGLVGGPAFALDAACASSLYAIKLACDRLHDRSADVMLAGAVNGADSLFLHVGFTALGALSATGQSRPFHRDADGLVPAEGAAVVALKRLADARAARDPILGVIRGIGLSNDGRGHGFLAPAHDGQVRAMRAAYAAAALAPTAVSLVECHATGTAVGDATEIRSMGTVFAGAHALAIGSLKSNFGHLITAAGVTGLIKVLGALAAEQLPPTLAADPPIAELAGSPFAPVARAAPWLADRPRVAAVSAFGFGGNNAHLVVSDDDPALARTSVSVAVGAPRVPIAIVGLGATLGPHAGEAAVTRALFGGRGAEPRTREVAVAATGLRFPPRDLSATLAQQLLVLEAAREAVAGIALPRERTAVMVGMGTDPTSARFGARWRLAAWADADAAATGAVASPGWLAAAREAVHPRLDAAGVIGAMPNIPANRINSQLDVAGGSFTVSAEQASGVVALELAAHALAAGELDVAIVGAVDVSDEPVHRAASDRSTEPGDAAVVIVVKRLADAERDGDRVLAVLDDGAAASITIGDADGAAPPTAWTAHAAHGLVHVAAAAWSIAHGARAVAGRVAEPWFGERRAATRTAVLGGEPVGTRLRAAAPAAPLRLEPGIRLHHYIGADRAAVVRAVAAGRASAPDAAGPAHLVIVAASADELAARATHAARALAHGEALGDGVAFRDHPVGGELAHVFTGAAAAYAGMGGELALALPVSVARVAARFGAMNPYTHARPGGAHPLDQLWATTFLSQLHADVTREVLGLAPHAAIGYSSGESNAMFALGAWHDLEAMATATGDSPLFRSELAGELSVLRAAWRAHANDGTRWAAWAIAAPAAAVHDAVAREPTVHVTIINSPSEHVIGGEAGACDRVVAALGRERAMPIDYAVAAHCPELRAVEPAWYALHHRPTTPVPGVRFYSAGAAEPFAASAEAIAAGITAQAMTTLDFPRMIERAWADGVRVFVEHGPRGLCTRWIGQILGTRDHVAVALDAPGKSDLRQLATAAAQLAAAGVAIDHAALVRALGEPVPARGPLIELAAHPPAIALPPRERGPQLMPHAPPLPPVIAAAPVAAPSAAPPPAIARALAVHEAVTAAHQAFLTAQSTAHTEFLAMRARMAATFLATAGRARMPAPAPPPPPPPAGAANAFTRADLEVLAAGTISSVFGPAFADQDGFARQVRMPMPPLLLADRVLDIAAEPGAMGTGSIRTQTDVTAASWYLHAGRMPAGIMIEAGQADLLLISWLGVDRLNRGERVYRLLGCELTFHGELPAPGDTLTYDIHIDQHARQGDVRLFFFHYDCRIAGALRLSVRGGQAGFFSDAELAESRGVLWDPADEPSPPGRAMPPQTACTKRAFTADEVAAFAAGRPADCFGAGWERARAHLRTPRISADRMLFLDEVTALDPTGGPWGRGYLRAQAAVAPDDWYFAGHFHNDPCMPGTLMFEGCLQALAFYLAALGVTLDRDGYRFEPVAGEPITMRCRGQVTPRSRAIVYEVFISDLELGAVPTARADLLCTVDGVKAFHARRVGLRLVPDFPLDAWRALPLLPAAERPRGPRDAPRASGLGGYIAPAADAVAVRDGFGFDYTSLLACAWGRPSHAFGPAYAKFDSPRRVPRLPGPPYHFISRVVDVDTPPATVRRGGVVVADYDVPPDAWYFAANGARTMPFCVLLEAALQPCGWFAGYMGVALTSEVDLMCRNLDGTGTLHADVRPDAGTLRTRVKAIDVSRTAGMVITSFEIETTQRGERVFSARTVFGFFPAEAFDDQPGLAITDDDRVRIAGPSEVAIDLRARPARYFAGAPRLPDVELCMLDRLTAWDPRGGRAGLGWARGDKRVDPGEWFFGAHFFQDPVQPGSLGVEALIQLLQLAMIERGIGAGMAGARFEAIGTGAALTWKYRGQVTPANGRITTEIELVEVGDDYATADGSLWVDGKRIYQVINLAMRVVPTPSTARAAPDLAALAAHWRTRFGVGAWPVEDLALGLVARFVRGVHVADPAALAAIRGRPCLVLANHEVGVESLLATLVLAPLLGTPLATLAKTEHRASWIGELIGHIVAHTGTAEAALIHYVDRDDRAALLATMRELADAARGGASALVHVEGTRALAADHRVAKLSSVFIDLALALDLPIVPLRFTGGLPAAPLAERAAFPIGFRGQDFWIGAPIAPAELRALPLPARKARVIDAINALGVGAAPPDPPDAAFAAQVAGAPAHEHAVLRAVLAELPEPSPGWFDGLRTWLGR